jgi:3-oxoacyl-[acyl-carrier protein] reductase
MSTIVISGTSRGIGRELASHYLSLGNTVIGISRNPSGLEKLSPFFHEFLFDVSNEDGVKNMCFAVGKIDVLINNAGISSMNHSLLTPISKAREIMDTNFIGTFLLSKECSKQMIHGGGRIINLSSIAYPLNLEGEAVYAASKAAIESLTRTMAHELGVFRITVNSVGPTPTMTDMIKSVPQEKITALLGRQAIDRFTTISDIVNVIDFFMKPESSFITGQTIYLGGIS